MSDAVTAIGLRRAEPAGVPERRQSLGQEDFLTLLTAQLRNQNPLSPLDNEAFVAQLAQFSTVSGITEMNRSLERLLEIAGRGDAAGAPQWLGRQVSGAGLSGTVTSVRFEPGGQLVLTLDERVDIPLSAVSAVQGAKGDPPA
ncbi:MAG: flagellar hook assembly protein FlgD [Thermaurantiacus sp.]